MFVKIHCKKRFFEVVNKTFYVLKGNTISVFLLQYFTLNSVTCNVL